MPHIRVMLDYFHPWPNSAGLYVARARRWYEEAGLDVELVVQDPGRGDTLEYLARGEVDFGIFPPNRLLARRAEHGQPLIAVSAINHRGLEAIQTTTSTGITRPVSWPAAVSPSTRPRAAGPWCATWWRRTAATRTR